MVTVGMSRSLSYSKLSSAAFKSHSCHSSTSADSPSKSKWERGAIWTLLFTAISAAALISTLLAVGIVSCIRSSQIRGSFRSSPARRAPLPGDIDIDTIRLYPGEDIDIRDSSWLSRLRESASPVAGPSVAGNTRKPMVVLVTGAGGFVGSHLALALKQRGDGVIGLDNFNDYYETSLKNARADRLRAAGIEILQADINNSSVLSLLFSRISFTHVAHLAAQAGVRYAMKNPQSYVHSNVAGMVTLLEACKRATPVPAIVWASSSSVYGLNKKVPFSEAHRTERPASLYAATKLAGEALAHSYNHIHGLSLTALRFFTVYGPWGRPDMAYFAFTKRIMEGKGINVFVGANKVIGSTSAAVAFSKADEPFPDHTQSKTNLSASVTLGVTCCRILQLTRYFMPPLARLHQRGRALPCTSFELSFSLFAFIPASCGPHAQTRAAR